MPELLKTSASRGRNSHYHIAYIRDDGTGATSVNHEHSHVIEYTPPAAPIMDMDGAVISEGTEGGWNILPSGGHSHTLEEYNIKEKEEKEDDKEKVNRVLKMYDEANKLEKESRARGYESEDFYTNKQWSEEDKKKLRGEDRAAVTINQIAAKIDNLSGYQRQNRTDIRYLPVENGDAEVADILNAVVKNITEQCYYQREKTKAFEDAAIVGRGLLNIFDDFDNDIQGRITIEKFKWDECRFGPHEKEDLSDCDFIVIEKWYSESRLKGEYPDDWDELSPETKLRDTRESLVSEDWDKRLRSDEFVDLSAKKYKVLICFEKKYKRTYILANSDDEFVFNAEGWSVKDVSSVKSIPGFTKIPRTTYKIHIYRTCVYKLLSEDTHDEQDFPILPIYAKFRNNQFYGKVEEAKDLQRLINKAYSQFVDIINKVANYGYFYDDDTFPDDRERQNWLNNAAKPGFNQRVSDAQSKRPVKEEGVTFPNELVNAISIFSQSMREIVNVNLELMGQGGQEQSGTAMRQKIVQQLLGNDYLFDNLSFVEAKLGRMIVQKIQKLYTPERILRILVNQDRVDGVEIAGEPLSNYTREQILGLLSNADLSNYDVIVTESPSAPSAMMGNFMMLLELAGKGIPIPPEAIMEFAPIPNKKKVLELIREQMERQQQMEASKQQTEIQKTLIAKSEPGQPGGFPQ